MHEIPVILFGVGGVGRALIRQIIENRAYHASQYGIALQLVAVCDRSSAVIELDGGLTDETLRELLVLKAAGNSLADHALGGDQNDLTGIVACQIILVATQRMVGQGVAGRFQRQQIA